MFFDEIDKHVEDIENVSEEVRENAIISLAQTNDVKAIFALKKVAREDASLRLRHIAKKALMELKKEITSVAPDLYLEDEEEDENFDLKKLKRYLTDPDPDARMNAVRSVVTAKDARAVDIIQACYQDENDARIKGSMLIALGILGKREMADYISNILKNEKEPLIKKSAIDGLSYTKDPTVYPLIIREFAYDNDKLVQRACMKALTAIGKSNLFELFARMLKSGKVWRRQAVARAMGKFNTSKVVPLLVKAMKDESKSVRSQAKRSLARLARKENPAALQAVEKLDIDITRTGVEKPGEKSVLIESTDLAHATAEGLLDPDPQVRIAILQKIAQEEDPTTLPSLRKRLEEDDDDRVRSVLVNVIARVAGPSGIPILKTCLKDPVPRVRANAIEALAHFKDPAHYPVLVECLEDSDARARANAIVALKDCGSVNLDQHIEGMIKSGDGRMIRSGIHAIEEIQSEKSVALLADLAMGSSQALKEKAIESLEILKERGSDTARKQLNRLRGEASESGAGGLFGDVPPPPPNMPRAEDPPPPEPEPEPEPPPVSEPSIPLPPRKSDVPPPEPEPEPEPPPAMTAPPPRIAPPPGLKPEPPRSKPKPQAEAAMAMPDFSDGFSAVALKAWFDSLPPVWRVATMATLMVWGMVLLMFFAESVGGGDDF